MNSDVELYKPFQPTLTSSGLKSFGLSIQQVQPSRALRGVVHSYLQVNTTKPTPYPVIPDGTQAFFISPIGVKVGIMNKRAFDLQLLERGVYFGVQFKPGALRCFFDIDLSEFSEQIVNSKQFVFSRFDDLCAAIYRTNSFYERAFICENWLLTKYTSKLSVKFNHAASLIYKSCGTNKISALANDVGCTSRHLSRLFQLYTGLSPKSFMQTIRLQHACKQLHLLRTSSSSMALELGYYDQSHLLNDFKKHFSCSPNRFFNRFVSDFYNSIQT